MKNQGKFVLFHPFPMGFDSLTLKECQFNGLCKVAVAPGWTNFRVSPHLMLYVLDSPNFDFAKSIVLLIISCTVTDGQHFKVYEYEICVCGWGSASNPI
jgi:hypothetical protein